MSITNKENRQNGEGELLDNIINYPELFQQAVEVDAPEHETSLAEEADSKSLWSLITDNMDRLRPAITYIGRDEQPASDVNQAKVNFTVEKGCRISSVKLNPLELTAELPIKAEADSSIPVGVKQSTEIYDLACRRRLTDLELKYLVMQRVSFKKKGEEVHFFNGKYYERLTKNGFCTRIFDALRFELTEEGSATRVKTVAESLMMESRIEAQERQTPHGKIVLNNGVLDIGSLCLEPFNPDYFITWGLDVDWSLEKNCPNFNRFMNFATGNDNVLLQRFLEAIGYMLVGEGNIAKRFIFMEGVPSSGKSLLASFIRSYFHEEDVSSTDPFRLGDSFALATMAHSRLNLCMDVANGYLPEAAVAVTKQCVGSDAVTVNPKYKEPYTKKLDTKMVFASNFPLRTSAYDQAFFDRILWLPFNYSVPKAQQDHYLLNRLMGERSAVFYRVVLAYKQLERNRFIFTGDNYIQGGYLVGKVDSVDSAEAILKGFAEETCIKDEENFVTTKELYHSYLNYCKTNGVRVIDNKQLFSAKLRPILEGNFQASRDKRRVDGIPSNGYKGIRLDAHISTEQFIGAAQNKIL